MSGQNVGRGLNRSWAWYMLRAEHTCDLQVELSLRAACGPAHRQPHPKPVTCP